MKSRTTLAIAFVGLGVAGVVLMLSVSGDPEPVVPARTTAKATTSAQPARPALPALPTNPTAPRGGIASFDCAHPSGAAARVDGVTLQLADLCARLSAFGAVMKQGTDRSQAKLVLDRMIDATVVRNALVQKRIKVDQKPLEKATGVAREELRERLELAALTETAPVTEAEIDAELARGAPGIDRGEGIEVEGWLLRIGPNDAGRDAAKQRMQDLAGKPEAFATAKDVKPIPRFVVGTNSVEPELEAAATALSKGKWSAPVQTKVGWAVIRVVRTVEGMALSDPKMRARVRNALEAKRLAEHKQTIAELRAAAHVEIFIDV